MDGDWIEIFYGMARRGISEERPCRHHGLVAARVAESKGIVVVWGLGEVHRASSGVAAVVGV